MKGKEWPVAHRGLSEGSSHLPRRLYQVQASLWISVIWFSQSPWERGNMVHLSRCEADLGGVWQEPTCYRKGLEHLLTGTWHPNQREAPYNRCFLSLSGFIGLRKTN